MAFVASSSLSVGYGFANLVTGDASPPISSTQAESFGPNAAIPYIVTANGGFYSVDMNIGGAVQHILLAASAPTLGNQENVGVNVNTGTASASFTYQYIDFATNFNTVAVPVKLSYNLDLVQAAGAAQLDYQVASGIATSTNTFTSFFPTLEGSVVNSTLIHPSDSQTITLQPGATLGVELDITGSVGSQAYTDASGIAHGLPAVLDFSHTGTFQLQELDANGNPLNGNPDLLIASGYQFGTASQPTTPGGTSALPEPSAMPLLALALAATEIVRRRAERSNTRRLS